ncbi:MerR family transcriptional regulator [Enterococcus hirae]|uniref:MerR family transcriptional regulator n=1 Tax=Enterococcus hirae TaxID=1354 RepID=UPI00136EC311|nr:helix-turn-helix domain-containing protein [Enterococcus hirae]NAE18209.1 MerR family transcriptional regulator [Enterococcus hirae]
MTPRCRIRRVFVNDQHLWRITELATGESMLAESWEVAIDEVYPQRPGSGRPPELMSAQEASWALHVDTRTLAKWANALGLRVARTPGGHRRYRRDDIEALTRRAS